MGACNFSDIQIVKGDSRVAYAQAREEANAENGHSDGYSGDIQTVEGYSDKTNSAPKFGTKAFYKWRDEQWEKMDKCDCIMVEIKGTELQKRKAKGKRGIRGFYFFGVGRE